MPPGHAIMRRVLCTLRSMWQKIASVLTVIVGLSLLAAAALRPAHAWVDPLYALPTGLFFLVMGFVGRFRRIRVGHFFEAEMWDEVQSQASDLARRLKDFAGILTEVYVDSLLKAGFAFPGPAVPHTPAFLYEKRSLIQAMAEINKESPAVKNALRELDEAIEQRMALITIRVAEERLQCEIDHKEKYKLANELRGQIGFASPDRILKEFFKKIGAPPDDPDLLCELEKRIRDIVHFKRCHKLPDPERWDRSW